MEIEKLIAFLNERKASLVAVIDEREAEWVEEGFDAQDMSGGNFDDAYYMGTEDGEQTGQVGLINEILKLIDGGHA